MLNYKVFQTLMDYWADNSHFHQIASCNSTHFKLQTLLWAEETFPGLAFLPQTYCRKMTWCSILKVAPSTNHPQRSWTTTATSATAQSPRQPFTSAAICPSAPTSTLTEEVSTLLNIWMVFLVQASITLMMDPTCLERPKRLHEINMR